MTKKTIDSNEEFIKKNYQKTIDLVNDIVKSDRKQKILDLFNFFDDRYATNPASQQKNYFSAFPGGLAWHNLNVLQWFGRFSSLMAKDQFSNESLLVVSFLHDIGKLGTKDKEYFLPQTSDWHKKQGILYEINSEIDFVKIPHRSLFLCQEFDVKLTQDEYLAILLQDGQNDDTNAHYVHKESKFTQIFQTANAWSMKLEREDYDY